MSSPVQLAERGKPPPSIAMSSAAARISSPHVLGDCGIGIAPTGVVERPVRPGETMVKEGSGKPATLGAAALRAAAMRGREGAF